MITMIEVGTSMTLKGKTLKGKNRINRGGHTWMVKAITEEWGLLMESVQRGEREMFWMRPSDDPNMIRLNGK
jgi:hypothetical protein